MERRGFLGAMLAACAAPAIVRAGSLMRVNPAIVLPDDGLFLRSLPAMLSEDYFPILSISKITAEALTCLENQLVFSKSLDREYDGAFMGSDAWMSINIRRPARFSA